MEVQDLVMSEWVAMLYKLANRKADVNRSSLTHRQINELIGIFPVSLQSRFWVLFVFERADEEVGKNSMLHERRYCRRCKRTSSVRQEVSRSTLKQGFANSSLLHRCGLQLRQHWFLGELIFSLMLYIRICTHIRFSQFRETEREEKKL